MRPLRTHHDSARAIARRGELVVLLLALVPCVGIAAESAESYAENYFPGDQALREDQVSETVLSEPSLYDSPDIYMGGNGQAWNPYQDPIARRQPSSWISGPYFQSGPTFVLGKGLLAEQQKVGYAITGGVRQPVGRGLGSSHVFVDLGGSYLSAFGELERLVPGQEFSPGDRDGTLVPDAFSERLTEVRRGSAHFGVGCYWGSPIDDRCSDPQVRLSTTLGGRLAHVRGRFLDEQIKLPPQNPGGVGFTPAYSRTDTVGGLYWKTEAVLLSRHTALGNMQWTLDGEFAHDWVDFGGFEKRGLGTAAILFGFMLSR